jgi:protein ImuB
MRRIVSVWLPNWPIERLRRHHPHAAPRGEPFALAASGHHGLVVTALTPEAAEGGIKPGMTLADARALLPALASRPAELAADRRALHRLARWSGRYGPNRNIDIGAHSNASDDHLLLDHGLWVDITGVAHLYGGEDALLADFVRRLAHFGVTARFGLADTLGAAHALARYACGSSVQSKPWRIAPAGQASAVLAPLPIAALRISESDILALRRLGLRRIGDLPALPRQSLERRFRGDTHHPGVLTRLDQALGRVEEPRRPLTEIPALILRHAFAVPLAAAEAIEAEVRQLIEEMCARLEAEGRGARRIRVALYRADGTMTEASAGTSSPVSSAPRLMRLLTDRLAMLDAGLGVDMISVEVPVAEYAPSVTVPLSAAFQSATTAAASELVDRLSSRLGRDRVTILAPHGSHIPERTELRLPALTGLADNEAESPRWPTIPSLRPPLLLARPEPITVTAEVPDGTPASFTWRRVLRRVTRAEGPERIAPEWWRMLPSAREGTSMDDPPQPYPDAPRTRDYYRLEDSGGTGYWVFRNGGYDMEAAAPAWYLHGVFA